MEQVNRVLQHAVRSIETSEAHETPFCHLRLSGVFPADIYAGMLEAMPVPSDYRHMSGRTKYTRTDEGGTRTKIDVFPEYIRHLPAHKKAIWRVISRVLCSPELGEAFRRRLAKPLEQRFGAAWRDVGVYPIPVLTRDVADYEIGIHSDTKSKGMTIQLYLPRDRSTEHIGTVFHAKRADGNYERAYRMPFAPNTGYAFAVGDDSYHSVDRVGPEVRTRDSILLTYFLDNTAVYRTKNRLKRLANFLLNEMRQLGR
jgi:hypothetical protein